MVAVGELPNELAEVVREVESSSGADTAVVKGLVQLVKLNEAFAARCLAASEATDGVKKALSEHEAASLILRNKRCGLLHTCCPSPCTPSLPALIAESVHGQGHEPIQLGACPALAQP